jgi:hypothetical protein
MDDRCIVITTSSTLSQETDLTMSDDDDDSMVLEQPENDDSKNNNAATLTFNRIWDDPQIKKIWDDNGKPRWQCKWCNRTFAGHSATKALYHVAKRSGEDVRICDKKIDVESKAAYDRLLRLKSNKRKSKTASTDTLNSSISTHHVSVASKLDESRKKVRTVSKINEQESGSGGRNSSNNRLITSIFTPQRFCGGTNASDVTRSTKRTSIGEMQTTLTGSNSHRPTADSLLTMAISDLIHSRGLQFSLASDAKFRKVLLLAKNVGTNYRPPGRNQVAGELLDLNYQAYMEKNMRLLHQDAEVFGVSFYGDGATVKKKALLNILASGVHLPSACLEIVDCTGHLEAGGKKDAKYIANRFLPLIKEFEERSRNTVDVALFDGASNVQKSGEVLAAIFPRMTVLHGAEHVVSLFFRDVFKNKDLSLFIRITRMIYKVFGSGSMHGPYAIFQKYARHHNQGRPIGLIRASDTRMGGHVISIMRLLRLQKALRSTVTSIEFESLKHVSFFGADSFSFIITHSCTYVGETQGRDNKNDSG